MRMLALIVLTVSLSIGLVGALSAYSVPLTLPDQQLIGLTLNADAGKTSGESQGAPKPIATKNSKLTAEALAALREEKVQRVSVKEFSLANWSGRWLFVGGLVGIAVGAALLRTGGKAAKASGAGTEVLDFAVQLRAIEAAARSLATSVAGRPSDEQAAVIMDGVSAIEREHLAPFLAARQALIARHGLASYARIIDAFSAGERRLYRAWSAAADNALGEAKTALHEAIEQFAEAANRVPQSAMRAVRPAAIQVAGGI